MKKILVLSTIVASLFASNIQIGIGFGRSSASDSPIKNYDYGNFRIGKYLPKNHILRLEFERATDISLNNKKAPLERLLLNVEHYFNFDSKFVSYAFVGGGYQWVKGEYDNSAVADLGVGARYNITKMFDVFVEARGLRDFHSNDNHYGILGGVEFNFGGEEAAHVKEVIEEPIKPVKQVVDSDGDGVLDNLDKCPNTPAGVKVDKNGCPIDSDYDGVPDYLDKCPNTPKSMKVDKNGCAISFNFNITFDTNSAKIKPEFIPEIKKFADFLKSHPDIKAEIQGYTDNVGKYEYNMVLSEKRAKAVYEALIKCGVNSNQLTWAGYGENNPIASNDTPEGRAKNRRVVAKIIY